MVKSKFCLKVYFSIITLLILGTVSFICGVFLCFEYFIGGIFFLIGAFFFYYLVIRFRKIKIYEGGMIYYSAIFPFLKGHLLLQDIDYYIIQRGQTNGYYTYDALLLIKNSKIRLELNPVVYSNCNEMADALPWIYHGEYCPGFWDSFRINTINENKIK